MKCKSFNRSPARHTFSKIYKACLYSGIDKVWWSGDRKSETYGAYGSKAGPRLEEICCLASEVLGETNE